MIDPNAQDELYASRAEQDWLRAEQDEQDWLRAEQELLTKSGRGIGSATTLAA